MTPVIIAPMEIVTVPNEILRQKARPVKKFDQKLARLISEMKGTLLAHDEPKGVGLAAPQVGENLALCLVRIKEDQVLTLVNPEVVRMEVLKKKEKPTGEERAFEGCLSLPQIYSPVRRAKKLLVAYQDERGRKKKKSFSGFAARVVQHEIDHLEGILFIQRALEQSKPVYRLEKDEKGKEVFKEVRL